MMSYAERLLRPTPLHVTPEAFLADACTYFAWCDDHPLQEETVFQYKGKVVRADKDKVRPYTKQGLALWIGMPVRRLVSYAARSEAWAEAVEAVEQVIYTQKFEHAAAGMLNAGLISRDLGLADKQELSGPNGSPIQTEELSARDFILGKLNGLAARIGEIDDSGAADG